MVRTNAPLIERMTLVWHSWFATSNQGVASQQLMLNQIDFFRGAALGSFADLLTGVTKDPAMLIWLNGNQNVKGKPNENYAREMMELFSLGADRGAYTETDVREQARALTGWTGAVNRGVIGNFAFADSRHDAGSKTIFGQTGNYTWTDSVNLCLNHPMHPAFFVNKMWSYFVPTPPDNATTSALAAIYKANGFKVHPVVEAILQHPDLYNGPRMVKSPRRAERRAAAHGPAGTSTPRRGGHRAQPRASSSSTPGRGRLGLHALARHGHVAGALVHRRAGAGHDGAHRHLDRSDAARPERDPASGAARRSRRRHRRCSPRSPRPS